LSAVCRSYEFAENSLAIATGNRRRKKPPCLKITESFDLVRTNVQPNTFFRRHTKRQLCAFRHFGARILAGGALFRIVLSLGAVRIVLSRQLIVIGSSNHS
jgi:hypothetical protein